MKQIEATNNPIEKKNEDAQKVKTVIRDLGIEELVEIKMSLTRRKTTRSSMEKARTSLKLSWVRPRLEYCIQAWLPYTRGDIQEAGADTEKSDKIIYRVSREA
ncbi:hypothetical protein Pmani_024629 [Petrolisthes manimaculis]|uniref:Uncharacterized protein n=1 Tax=Petrolisthes manimaculis TaxID=1843537 RepID=A0AAE1P7S3_9EUCA|nr:hypothetical protein Pmani_024629 [Petrolisthes manimaculis]